FSGGVQSETLAVLRQADDVAVARPTGGRDAAKGPPVNLVDLLAGSVHLQNLHLRGDEGVAVAQALHVDGRAGQPILGPQDLALEIALADASAVVLSDEDTVARQDPGIDGEEDVVDGPAFLAVAANLVNTVAGAIAQQRIPEPGARCQLG